jgi:hypothetical protein
MKRVFKKLAKDQSGVAVLMVVLIVASVLLSIALTMGNASITENQINLYQSQSNQLMQNLDGCGDEALIRLNRNSLYAGETLILDGTTCVISLSGSGSTRTISILGSKDAYTKKLQINATIFPTFTVTSWQEVTP